MKILIAEDEKPINDLVATVVKMLGHTPIQVFDGDSAIQTLVEETIDLMLLDIIMPKTTGFEVLEFCQLEQVKIPTVILSALDSDKDQLKGFTYPIEDFWVKPLSFAVLMKKLERLIVRVAGDVGSQRITVDDEKCDVVINGKSVGLTRLEYRLFRFLYSNKGRYCSKVEIVDKTWGSDSEVDERNVDFTIKRIRKKLGEDATCIQTKAKVGYVYESQE
ncbi:MAG: response regulator transcription factor [Culicoidibacterales bacterium]